MPKTKHIKKVVYPIGETDMYKRQLSCNRKGKRQAAQMPKEK